MGNPSRSPAVYKAVAVFVIITGFWVVSVAAQRHLSSAPEYPLVYRIYDRSTPVEVLVSKGSVKLLEGRSERVQALWEARGTEGAAPGFRTGVVLDIEAGARDSDADGRLDGIQLTVDGRLRTYQGTRREETPAGGEGGFVVMPVIREEGFRQSSYRALPDPQPVSFQVSGSDGQKYRVELLLGLVR